MTNLSWLPFALMSIAGIAAYGISMKAMNNSINPFLFSAIMNGAGCLFSAVMIFLPVARTGPLLQNKIAIYVALGCGVATVLIDVGYFLMMRSSNGLTIGAPFVGVVNIIIMTLAGYFIFREQLTWQSGLGIAFGLISVWLLTYKAS